MFVNNNINYKFSTDNKTSIIRENVPYINKYNRINVLEVLINVKVKAIVASVI